MSLLGQHQVEFIQPVPNEPNQSKHHPRRHESISASFLLTHDNVLSCFLLDHALKEPTGRRAVRIRRLALATVIAELSRAAIVLLVLSEVFRTGTRLDEDQSLTV